MLIGMKMVNITKVCDETILVTMKMIMANDRNRYDEYDDENDDDHTGLHRPYIHWDLTVISLFRHTTNCTVMRLHYHKLIAITQI